MNIVRIMKRDVVTCLKYLTLYSQRQTVENDGKLQSGLRLLWFELSTVNRIAQHRPVDRWRRGDVHGRLIWVQPMELSLFMSEMDRKQEPANFSRQPSMLCWGVFETPDVSGVGSTLVFIRYVIILTELLFFYFDISGNGWDWTQDIFEYWVSILTIKSPSVIMLTSKDMNTGVKLVPETSCSSSYLRHWAVSNLSLG